MEIANLLYQLQAIADEKFDGHYTILCFTTNYRIGFRTPSDRLDFENVPAMPDLLSALNNAIEHRPTFY